MASPVVAATATSAETADTTTHTVSLPGSISSGDLLVVTFTNDGGGVTVTFPGSGVWTQLFAGEAAAGDSFRVGFYYTVATGSEGATISVTTSASERSAHVAYRITGGDDANIEAATLAEQNTEEPDPPAITPSGGSDDYLIIPVVATGSRDITTPTYPTNYINGVFAESGADGLASAHATAAMASREITGTTEDPGIFTQNNTQPTLVNTVAIGPAGAFDPANLQASVLGDDVTLTWDASF